MTAPANRGYPSRARVRVVNEDMEPVAASSTHGPARTNVTASGDTSVVAAAGANLAICVTAIWLSNQAVTKVRALLREGAAGTVRFGGTLAADGGGMVQRFTPPWKLPDNTALVCNLDGAGDVDVNVQFYVE